MMTGKMQEIQNNPEIFIRLFKIIHKRIFMFSIHDYHDNGNAT